MHTIAVSEEELRLLREALHAYLDDFGLVEAYLLRQFKALIAKLASGSSRPRGWRSAGCPSSPSRWPC